MFQFAISHVVDGGGRPNIIEPQAGKKNQGWDWEEVPPRNYENWLHHTATEEFAWLEACADAGTRAATVVVAAEDSIDGWKQGADFVVGAGADAALTINAAIAALPFGTGGRVLLADGIYTLKSQVVINRINVWLQGQGPQTRLRVATLAAISAGVSITHTGARVTDLALESDSGAAGATYANAIRINGPTDFILDRLTVQALFGGPTTYGPVVPKGVAFHVVSGTGVISHCQVIHVTTAPLASSEAVLVEAGRVLVHDCRFEAPSFGGTAIATGSVYAQSGAVLLLSNCFMERSNYGIELASAGPSLIANCEISQTASHGLQIDGATIGLKASNIQIFNAGGAAVNQTALANNCALHHVEAYNPATSGFVFAGDTCELSDCRCHSPSNHGFNLAGNTLKVHGGRVASATQDGCYVAGNDCEIIGLHVNGARNGVALTGDNNLIAACKVDGTISNDGIDIANGATGNTVTGCKIEQVGVTGIDTAGADSHLTGNSIYDPTGAGISLASTATGSEVVGNKVVAAGASPAAAIYCAAEQTNINGNKIHQPGAYGIHLAANSCGVVGNHINAPGDHGIYLNAADGNNVSENTIDNVAVAASQIFIDTNSDNNKVHENILRASVIQALYGINHDGNSPRGNSINGNWMYNAGSTADLRIAGVLTNARQLPTSEADCTTTNVLNTSTTA
jgi:parallel beta-helix repeat protein